MSKATNCRPAACRVSVHRLSDRWLRELRLIMGLPPGHATVLACSWAGWAWRAVRQARGQGEAACILRQLEAGYFLPSAIHLDAGRSVIWGLAALALGRGTVVVWLFQ